MTKVVQLKCPNCGANIPRETLKCEYCGASFILSKDNRLLPKKVIVCPECGQELPEDSVLCLQCGKILTKSERDVKKLRHIQNKIRATQKTLRESIYEKVPIEDDEYLFLIDPKAGGSFGKKYWIVTNKRVMTYEEGRFLEVKYEDVVDIPPAEFKPVGFFKTTVGMTMNIETFDGTVTLTSRAPPFDQNQLALCTITRHAFQVFEKKVKDLNFILLRLEFKE